MKHGLIAAMSLLLTASPLAHAGTAVSLDQNAREVKSRFDPRIRVIEYNPLDIVTIKGVFGYSTHVQFAPDEKITSVAAGDSLAWDFMPRENHLFLKPKEPDGRTNVAIITTKRLYQFVVDSRTRDKVKPEEMELFVIFTYENDPKLKRDQDKVDAAVATTVSAMEKPPSVVNRNFDGCRKNSHINPAEVWDDGRFTYLRFLDGQPLPVALAVMPDGSSAVPNFRMDGRTMVLFETAPRFKLTLGEAESCIVNRAYGTYAAPNDDGTTVNGVQRFMRRGEQ
ncbi:TrbG/VirB9 family P-type conjugative transfer protein [Xanthomonas arboricola]|uniref:TrbG/VirB9 family P-type conjugative transfer protein n=1 Tax=Xanthomonas arboricola TaxID=56448 RepID=UPI000AE55618|nr:TrbG/VirB9 family P-type conjugative transfer protein [Xanthomonas arboricola]